MNKNKVMAAVALSFAVTALFFSNCSQPGEIKLSSAETVQPLAQQETVQEIISNCDRALQTGQLKSLNQSVTFDDTRTESGRSQICAFPTSGEDMGNLPINNGYMQARYEQVRKLNLPANAVLCDVQMTNDLQSFRYDDVFFFNFNGFLLASNNKSAINSKWTPERVSLGNNQTASVYKYNWLSIRTAPFQNVADDYCLGKAEGLAACSWPVTEQQGRIQFSFDRSLLIALSAHTPSDQQQFSFVITGDNDHSIDCYHERLSFNMSVKYYLKQ